LNIRTDLRPEDRAPLEELLRATGFFNPRELKVALEVVDDKLARGEKSDYRFLILEDGDRVQGYVCWGPITVTVASADLYWMAVHPASQGQGLGRTLLEAAEMSMAREGHTRVYLETSTRAQYAPTRAFYLHCGYAVVAELPDFYTPGDGKAIFLKILPRIH
jgi:GNAT superfamily N-acetyltransferase